MGIEENANGEGRIVYVRPVEISELPQDVQDAAEGVDMLFALHDADGERLALVKDRRMAFMLAREHDYSPVGVH